MFDENNILKQDMVEEKWTAEGKITIDIRELKKGDVVKLKGGKFAQIISSGELAHDIDYGLMYKNIKRYKLIDENTYYILNLEKERDNYEKKILNLKKEKLKLDILIFLAKNSEVLAQEYDSELYDEFKKSKNLCHNEIGSFYLTDEGEIKIMVCVGYNTAFYKVNLSEKIILKIDEALKKAVCAETSRDVPDFEDLGLDS